MVHSNMHRALLWNTLFPCHDGVVDVLLNCLVMAARPLGVFEVALSCRCKYDACSCAPCAHPFLGVSEGKSGKEIAKAVGLKEGPQIVTMDELLDAGQSSASQDLMSYGV